ncbi:MAG: hypothetical protein KDA31_02575 [Phycisphaerales bacterium]|nr:hypothetical protein [Phycisphaerales bacterium]MCB9837021.1 hypothetical protein [Phycisphaera sp.]
MISKTIAGMCVLGFAANCAAQLQEYSFDEPYRAPSEASITCFDGVHIAPDYEIMYFDIRLPPSSQPTGSFSGTFVIDGDCDAGGSFARSIILSSFCDGGYPDAGTNSLRFAFAADPIPTGTPLYGLSGQPESEIKIYVGFQPGDSVGPGNSFGNGMLLGQSPLYLDDNPLFNNPHDIDVVGDGIIFGIEITETDGVHYGWIEIRRAPDADPLRINHCSERYYITRYAYELTPGVPALVTGTPCLADTNGDGMLSPADFSAWVAAFNANAPECDQNEDGMCSPADFSAWVANYNAGC